MDLEAYYGGEEFIEIEIGFNQLKKNSVNLDTKANRLLEILEKNGLSGQSIPIIYLGMKVLADQNGRVWYIRVPEERIREKFPLELKYDIHLRLDDKNTICRLYHNMILQIGKYYKFRVQYFEDDIEPKEIKDVLGQK